MEIASRKLRVILRNPDNRRTCELRFNLKRDRWLVKCYMTTPMRTCFEDLEEWPIHDSEELGEVMLNSYENLEEAVEAFGKWTS